MVIQAFGEEEVRARSTALPSAEICFPERVSWKLLTVCGRHGPFSRAAVLTAAALPTSVRLRAAEGLLLTQHQALSSNACGRGPWGLAERGVKNGMYVFIFP